MLDCVSQGRSFVVRAMVVVLVPAVGMFVLTVLITTFNMKEVGLFCSVYPRTAPGLKGIALCWAAHWSYLHYFGNMSAWVGLAPGLLLYGFRTFCLATAFIQITSASFAWMAARSAYHAGLSGVLCGYFGFLVSAVVWIRPVQVKFLAVMLVTSVIYMSTFVATVLSMKDGVSWELHAFGIIAGVSFAYVYYKIFRSLEPHSIEMIPLATESDTAVKDLGGMRVSPSSMSTTVSGADSGGGWWNMFTFGNKDLPSGGAVRPGALGRMLGSTTEPMRVDPDAEWAIELDDYDSPGDGSSSSSASEGSAAGGSDSPRHNRDAALHSHTDAQQYGDGLFTKNDFSHKKRGAGMFVPDGTRGDNLTYNDRYYSARQVNHYTGQYATIGNQYSNAMGGVQNNTAAVSSNAYAQVATTPTAAAAAQGGGGGPLNAAAVANRYYQDQAVGRQYQVHSIRPYSAGAARGGDYAAIGTAGKPVDAPGGRSIGNPFPAD